MRAVVRIVVIPLLGVASMAGASEAATAPEVLRWNRYEAPEFPPALQATVVRDGFAMVMFTFDEDGNITDRIVVAASHPAFSAAVLEVVSRWQIDGTGYARAVRRETLRFNFERRGSVVSLSQRDANKSAFTPFGDQAAAAVRTFREEEIDAPLQLLTNILPAYPPSLQADGVEGFATLSFVLDAEGRARVPAVTTTSHSEFAAVALDALRQWRFVPAQRNGERVQVLAERTLTFRLRRKEK